MLIFDSTTMLTEDEADFLGFSWEVTDKSVASVSSSGTLTALKAGETIIRGSLKKYPDMKAEFRLLVQDHIVYTVGSFYDTMFDRYDHIIWKSNQPEKTLPPDEKINSIGFSGNNIYAVGNKGGRPCYWKNGAVKVLTDMGGDYRSDTYGIAVSGNDMYMCGYCRFFSNKTVALWKNDELIYLIHSLDIRTDSEGKAVSVAGDDIYVGGYIKNNRNIMVASYWKNDQRVDLSDGETNASIESMFIEGTDVYATGWYENDGAKILCYWKNGVKTDLTYDSSTTNSVLISNGNIYACGSYKDGTENSTACYWLNDTKISMDVNNAVSSYANSIKVVYGDIYVAGYYTNDKNETTGCYWINGKKMDLHHSSTNYKYETTSYSTIAYNLAVD